MSSKDDSESNVRSGLGGWGGGRSSLRGSNVDKRAVPNRDVMTANDSYGPLWLPRRAQVAAWRARSAFVHGGLGVDKSVPTQVETQIDCQVYTKEVNAL
jgi:hypothetical protein